MQFSVSLIRVEENILLVSGMMAFRSICLYFWVAVILLIQCKLSLLGKKLHS